MLSATTNWKTMENSAYQNWQVFADFELRPTQRPDHHAGYQIRPFDHHRGERRGTRMWSCASEATACKNQPLVGSETLSSPLYFLTALYSVRPDSVGLYGQVATSFALLGLPDLYYAGGQPQLSCSPRRPSPIRPYRAVFSHGNITADADAFRVDASNLQVSCIIDDPLLRGIHL